jgi:dienelactone hydrolase
MGTNFPVNLGALDAAPPRFAAEGVASGVPGIQALFYAGLPWRGRPTRVFAWLGIPEGARRGEIEVPGMVLIHGGGGTAFRDWVALWMARGYAAIAMDTCGALPEPADAQPRPRHPHGGPPGWSQACFAQVDEDPRDQWPCHAVAAAVLGHSLLRAQPGVDPDRIGVTGVSWGGFLACLVAGTDHRFRLAAPVYGCGHYRGTVFAEDLRQIGEARARRWLELWDPTHFLADVRMPMLWLNGTNDFAYWLPAWQVSHRRIDPALRTLALRVRMPHGHGGPGEKPPEIAVQADALFRGGEPLARIVAQESANGELRVAFASSRPIVRAELNFTADAEAPWPQRQWHTLPAHLGTGEAVATVPPEAVCHCLNLVDDRGCVVSGEVLGMASSP